MTKEEAEAIVVSTNPDSEWMMMMHPDLEDSYAEVTQTAFDEVHSPNGWVKADVGNAPTPVRSGSTAGSTAEKKE